MAGESPAKSKLNDNIEVYQKALDDIVNVNSLFTIAVFIGLSYAAPNQHSLEVRPQCGFDPNVARNLVVFEVVSFACFLLSSLVAKSLKVGNLFTCYAPLISYLICISFVMYESYPTNFSRP